MRRAKLLAPAFLALVAYPFIPARSVPDASEQIAESSSLLPPERPRNLLQGFAAGAFRRGFMDLGEERDCDHGHLLYAAEASRPFAILYHTQELPAASGRGSLDPGARNWLQWVDTGRVEDARSYVRGSYPRSAYWDWFRAQELPRYGGRGTIVPQMLEPARLGAAVASSRQWVFTRVSCRGPATSTLVGVSLPGQTRICLRTTLQ